MPITKTQFDHATADSETRLRTRREALLEERFRESLLGDGDEILIAGENFHPADVLHNMAEETYRIAKSDSDQEYRNDFVETILDEYPSPIALPFNAFKHGATNDLSRLGFMCDTWEAVVSVCFAIIIAECAAKGIKLGKVLMRDGPNNAPREMKKRDLRSGSITVRLGVIEGILVFADQNKIPLASLDTIPVELIEEMRRLNDVRNGFSHEQTKSESQASRIIEECEQELLDVLVDLNNLAIVDFYRLHQISKEQANKLEVEPLKGHMIARRIVGIDVDTTVITSCASTALTGGSESVLFRMGSEVFFGSPYFLCKDDDSGHQTHVLMLKRLKTEEGSAEYEVSARSETIDIPLTSVQPEIDRIAALMEA